VEELRKRGDKALEATNMLKWRSKELLHIFMLTFRHDGNTNKIYEITDILGMRMEIHPIRKSRLIPQCKRCQAYGHTQRYQGCGVGTQKLRLRLLHF
jgi:hypothetical protein